MTAAARSGVPAAMVVVGVLTGSTLCWAVGVFLIVLQVGADLTLLWWLLRDAGAYRPAIAGALLEGRFLSWPARWVLRRVVGPL